MQRCIFRAHDKQRREACMRYRDGGGPRESRCGRLSAQVAQGISRRRESVEVRKGGRPTVRNCGAGGMSNARDACSAGLNRRADRLSSIEWRQQGTRDRGQRTEDKGQRTKDDLKKASKRASKQASSAELGEMKRRPQNEDEH